MLEFLWLARTGLVLHGLIKLFQVELGLSCRIKVVLLVAAAICCAASFKVWLSWAEV